VAVWEEEKFTGGDIMVSGGLLVTGGGGGGDRCIGIAGYRQSMRELSG